MRSLLLLGLLAFVLLQLAPAPYSITTPPIDKKLVVDADPDVPPPVKRILRRACMDCHSNETRIPWYGRVAPASWLLAKDVTEGRQAMNFSDWGSRGAAVHMAMAAAACEHVRRGRMPKPQYLMIHPEARLSSADIEVMCGWSKAALAAMSKKKKQTENRTQDATKR